MKKKMRNVLAGVLSVMILPTAVMNINAEDINKPHNTNDTLFSVASVSKMFVTAAAMQLAKRCVDIARHAFEIAGRIEVGIVLGACRDILKEFAAVAELIIIHDVVAAVGDRGEDARGWIDFTTGCALEISR